MITGTWVIARGKDVRAQINNFYSPVYIRIKKKQPSGTNHEDLLELVLDELWLTLGEAHKKPRGAPYLHLV